MERREIIALLGIAAFQAASRPLRAQGAQRVRIAFLGGAVSTPEGGTLTGSLETIREGLHRLGWREGETFEMDARFASGDFSIIPRLAAELVAWRPDVIVSAGSTETKALQAVTREIPIVFLQIPD